MLEYLTGLLDTRHHDVTLISLALTPATILAAAIVVALWWKPTKKAIFVTHKKDVQWFMVGVFASFIGSIVDNLYWGLAWTADYYDHPIKEALFKYGVYPNTIFRQGCTLVAAYCHIRAAAVSDSKSFKGFVLGVWVLTFIIGGFLILGSK